MRIFYQENITTFSVFSNKENFETACSFIKYFIGIVSTKIYKNFTFTRNN